jgi:hypothetical protein
VRDVRGGGAARAFVGPLRRPATPTSATSSRSSSRGPLLLPTGGRNRRSVAASHKDRRARRPDRVPPSPGSILPCGRHANAELGRPPRLTSIRFRPFSAHSRSRVRFAPRGEASRWQEDYSYEVLPSPLHRCAERFLARYVGGPCRSMHPTSGKGFSANFACMEFLEDHTLHSRSPTPMGRPWMIPAAFGVLQLCTHKLGREPMTDMLTTATLIERLDAMDAEELDRLQAAIDRRRGELVGEEALPTASHSSTVVERRAYGSGVLQLE